MGFACDLNLPEALKLLAWSPSTVGATEFTEPSWMREGTWKVPVVGDSCA